VEPAGTDAAAAVLDGLDEEQRAAVLAPLGPLRILAGAGTGKTRSITHRIAYYHHLGEAPSCQVLAVTHSRRAAAEMGERLERLGVAEATVATFHAAARRQLITHWGSTGLPGGKLQQLDTRDRFGMLRQVLGNVLGKPAGQNATDQVRDLGVELSWAAVRCLTPETYGSAATSAGRGIGLDPAVVASCYQQFRDLKRTRKVLDFDDLLDACASLFEQVPKAFSAFAAQHRHFVVDEYQDTDPAQQRLLRAWLGDRQSICVVGDPHQAIYAFKGADPNLIHAFSAWRSGGATVSLVRDYRSTPQVVAVANRIVGAAVAGELVGQQPCGPDPTLAVHPDDEAEVLGLVNTVRSLLDKGVKAEEIAVLHRFNAQALPLRTALLQAGIATSIGEEERFFERSEVRRALSAFAQRSRHGENVDALSVMKEVLASQGFDPQNPPAELGGPRERHDGQGELLRLVASLPEPARQDAESASAELARRAEQERVPTSETGVSVLTLHKAKGLEWDAVILPRMTDGSLPASMARTAAQQEEERRLFYVGVTRARRHLHLSHSTTWNGKPSRPSPYLLLLRPPPPPSPKPPPQKRPSGHTPKPAVHKASSAATKGSVSARWPIGQRVVHDRFGMGTVTALHGTSVSVDFGATYGVRVVSVTTRKMAKL
jgi:DNA helicase-2/ATP-dependent DNA helicase PcrA